MLLFFRTGVTNQRENKTYYKVTPTRHIHTGTHIQAGSRHSQKEKNRGLKIIYLKKTIKKMFRPSTTTTTTTRLLVGNSRSKNHDTNTNEMWTLFLVEETRQTVKVQTIAKWQNIWAVGSHANALRSLKRISLIFW